MTTVTTQQTSKRLKIQLLISAFLCCFGILNWFLPYGHSMELGGVSWAAGMGILGAIWYVIIKVMIWWQHD